MLTDKQIQDAVFAVLRKWKDDRAWDRYTRESGPYDATILRPEVLEIIRAVLDVTAGTIDLGARYRVEFDGFVGTVIGSYKRLDGENGVVMQQDGSKVVHVYRRKWLQPAAAASAEGCLPASEHPLLKPFDDPATSTAFTEALELGKGAPGVQEGRRG